MRILPSVGSVIFFCPITSGAGEDNGDNEASSIVACTCMPSDARVLVENEETFPDSPELTGVCIGIGSDGCEALDDWGEKTAIWILNMSWCEKSAGEEEAVGL